jgi:hypothetical protein
MIIYDVQCNSCGFHLDSGTGSDVYVTDEKGERIICPHPIEFDTVLRVLGKNATKELIDERTGELQHWLCLSCLSVCELDLKRDRHECGSCRSTEGKSVMNMIGETCPKCGKGKISLFDTGLET